MKHLLWFSIALLLSACETLPIEPVRIPDLDLQDAGQNAYLWTSGYAGQEMFPIGLADYATITQINDVKVPAKYLPKWSYPPLSTSLLEIPSGNHTVEILYKEEALLCGMFGCFVAVKYRQTLTFTAEPNRTYRPFVADKCSKDFFWIEDRGLYVEGSKYGTKGWESDLTKPVVAGERPIKGSWRMSALGR